MVISGFKFGVIVHDVEPKDWFAAVAVTPESPLPVGPVAGPNWAVVRLTPQMFSYSDPPIAYPDGFGSQWEVRSPTGELSFWFDLGLAQGSRRAYWVGIANEHVAFYKPIVIANAFFWATKRELEQVRDQGTTPGGRGATWRTRADALIAAWLASPVRGEIKIWDRIAGWNFDANADNTAPGDLM